MTFYLGEMQLSPQKQQLVPQRQAVLLLLAPMLFPCGGPLRVGTLGHDALHGPFSLHALPQVGREEIERAGVLVPTAAPSAAGWVCGRL